MWQWPQEVRLNVYLLVYHAKWGIPAKLLKRMAGTTGLEPAASAVTGQRSNQLNYVPTAIYECIRGLPGNGRRSLIQYKMSLKGS